MHDECEYCVKRKYCVKCEPKDNSHCEDYEEDEKLFSLNINHLSKIGTYEFK